MIEDPISEEMRKYGRPATVKDFYTKEKIDEMRKDLEKGRVYVIKDGKLVAQ